MKYSQTIFYTTRDGAKGSYRVSGCDTLEEAQEYIKKWALNDGWTPPKRWQWWRRHDTKTLEY